MRSLVAVVLACTCLAASLLNADQTPADRQRARVQNRLGWEQMRAERWDRAAAAFQRAVEIDPTYEYAYYGLGRAELGRRQFRDAIAALERSRALYQAETGRQFANAQEAQRYRQDRMSEIDEQIRLLRSGPQSVRTQDLLRQLENLRRELQDRLERGRSLAIEDRVPAFVSLSLGSAYFRAGRLGDAEAAYKATTRSDPKSGEAFSNLAALYLEMGRLKEAADAVQSAKRVGFRVNPELEREIQSRTPPR